MRMAIQGNLCTAAVDFYVPLIVHVYTKLACCCEAGGWLFALKSPSGRPHVVTANNQTVRLTQKQKRITINLRGAPSIGAARPRSARTAAAWTCSASALQASPSCLGHQHLLANAAPTRSACTTRAYAAACTFCLSPCTSRIRIAGSDSASAAGGQPQAARHEHPLVVAVPAAAAQAPLHRPRRPWATSRRVPHDAAEGWHDGCHKTLTSLHCGIAASSYSAG